MESNGNTPVLDYGRPEVRAPSSVVAAVAGFTLAYPIVPVAALYGQWLLSWYFLGHAPRPSLDDPKFIAGASWMHSITAVALVTYLPMAFMALGFNVLYLALLRPDWQRIAPRGVLLFTLWAGTFALLRWDPGNVVYWWFD